MKIRRAIVRIACTSVALFAAYATLLRVPEPFFLFAVRADSLTLHSDQSIPEPAARSVLALARTKLETSPLYVSSRSYDVFLCNSRWRQMLFFNKDYGVGGVAPYPLSDNVFLRDARVEDNRLISPRRTPGAGDRTLDYFIAHELTHQLAGHALGPIRYYQLPQWVREGYADYVGKGPSFHYDEARRAFLAGAPEMDWKRSGLYRRFHLLVAYLLDRQGWTVARLLRDPPRQESVESAIRAEKP